jgi:hypothetical protein
MGKPNRKSIKWQIFLIGIRLDEIGLNANVCIEHTELLF